MIKTIQADDDGIVVTLTDGSSMRFWASDNNHEGCVNLHLDTTEKLGVFENTQNIEVTDHIV